MVLALSFLVTVTLEWVVLAWFSKLGFARTGWFCLAMNGATWGAANGILAVADVPVPVLELAIILMEAVVLGWFWKWRPGHAMLGSVLMNLTSWLVGAPIALYLARRL